MGASAIQKVQQLVEATHIKSSLLCDGICIDPNIITLMPYKARIEHLYRHDRGFAATFPYPQEILLFSDPILTHHAPVIVNLRHHPYSSWKLQAQDGKPVLVMPSGEQRPVQLQPAPPFYETKTSTGSAVSHIVQLLGNDLAGVIPHNYCFYFARKQECVFCEIVDNYRKSRTYPTVRKPLQDQVEALEIAIQPENNIRHVVLTAGNHATHDETAQLYVEIIQQLAQSPNRAGLFIFGSLMAPDTFSYIDAFKLAGFDAIAFNLEAWRPDIFARIAPGKASYGRQKMLDALDYAVAVFGAGFVYTNLVYGIQSLDDSLQPDRFDAMRETELCLEATAALLSRGIVPLYTIYHSTGRNKIGQIALPNQPVFDFYMRYGQLVHQAGIIAPERNGVLFHLGSISNHLYNDALIATRALELGNLQG